MESEDEVAHLSLQSEIEQTLDPKDVFGRIRIQDLTDKLWEERRLKQSQTNVILTARVDALGSLLQPYCGENIPKAMRIAQDYFSSDTPARAEAAQLVASLNITSEMIEATAIYLRVDTFEVLDQMRGRRENARYHLMKDYDRQERRTRKKAHGRPGESSDMVLVSDSK